MSHGQFVTRLEMGTPACSDFEDRVFYKLLSLQLDSAMSDDVPILSEAKKP